jgi:hypothetical protein
MLHCFSIAFPLDVPLRGFLLNEMVTGYFVQYATRVPLFCDGAEFVLGNGGQQQCIESIISFLGIA